MQRINKLTKHQLQQSIQQQQTKQLLIQQEQIKQLTAQNQQLASQNGQITLAIQKLSQEYQTLCIVKEQILAQLNLETKNLQNAIEAKNHIEKQLINLQEILDETQREFFLQRNKLIDPNEFLLNSAKEGDFDKVHAALNLLGADIETQDAKGITPLGLSLLNGHLELATFLLNRSANMEVIAKNNYALLNTVFEKGDAVILNFILNKLPKDKEGKHLLAVYNATNHQELKANVATILLFQASKQGNIELAKKAISLGAKINAQDSKYLETPLHKAVFSGQLNLVKFLLENGCSVKIEDRNGQTAIDATSNKEIQTEIFNYLKKQSTIIQAGARGFFARQEYTKDIKQQGMEILKKFASAGKYDEISQLTTALKENRLAEVVKIINANSETLPISQLNNAPLKS